MQTNNTNFSDTYDYLNNNIKHRVDPDKDKCSTLQASLDQGLWSNSVLQDPSLPYLALSLFKNQSITREQCSTCLYYYQLRQCFDNIQCVSLLNQNNKFSEQAKELLIPNLLYKYNQTPFTVAEINELENLLVTLPPSERVIFTSPLQSYYAYYTDPYKGMNSLGIKMNVLDVLPRCYKHRLLVHYSFGLFDLIGRIKFHDEYVKPVLRLGHQSVNDIESGIRNKIRPSAILFPNTTHNYSVHYYEDCLAYELTGHDFYHSNIMSMIPNKVIAIILHCADVLRLRTGFQWSKEIWEWIDFEYIYYLHHGHLVNALKLNTAEEITHSFFKVALYGNSQIFSQGAYLLLDDKLTVSGIIILLDILFTPKPWHTLGFDENYLPDSLALHFQLLKKYRAKLQGVSFPLACLMAIFITTRTGIPESDLDGMLTKLEKLNALDLTYKKLSQNESKLKLPDELKNIIQLAYRNEIINYEILNNILLENELSLFIKCDKNRLLLLDNITEIINSSSLAQQQPAPEELTQFEHLITVYKTSQPFLSWSLQEMLTLIKSINIYNFYYLQIYLNKFISAMLCHPETGKFIEGQKHQIYNFRPQNITINDLIHFITSLLVDIKSLQSYTEATLETERG